jgi:hypothetical protein
MTEGGGSQPCSGGGAAGAAAAGARRSRWTRAAAWARTHPTELAAYVCDAATATLVVAVQDVAFKEVGMGDRHGRGARWQRGACGARAPPRQHPPPRPPPPPCDRLGVPRPGNHGLCRSLRGLPALQLARVHARPARGEQGAAPSGRVPGARDCIKGQASGLQGRRGSCARSLQARRRPPHPTRPLCGPKVFPKSIEIMVPAICLGLVVPAWLHEEATHRVVGRGAAGRGVCGGGWRGGGGWGWGWGVEG